MRIHFLIAFLIILLGVYLNFNSMEIITLSITIILVLTAEMLNTSIELVVDIVKSEFHPIARVIKDVSAGAVLLTSINAAIVGYILFSKNIPFNIEVTSLRIKQSPWHITFISLILVFGLTILGKIFFHKGTPLRGGMPSGHAAMAFAIWAAIFFLTNNFIVVSLAFVMAFIIARHRVTYAIHNLWEVVVGSLLGILVTTLVFQLFR